MDILYLLLLHYFVQQDPLPFIVVFKEVAVCSSMLAQMNVATSLKTKNTTNK